MDINEQTMVGWVCASGSRLSRDRGAASSVAIDKVCVDPRAPLVTIVNWRLPDGAVREFQLPKRGPSRQK